MGKKRPKTAYQKQKIKTWDAFSRMVRIQYSDIHGQCQCVTCKVVKHYKKLQAGHFVDGRGNSILFDERGVYPQCYGCNISKSGNKVEYFRFMQKEQGDKTIDALRSLKHTVKKFNIVELKDMEEHYKKETAFILRERGIE